MPFCPQCGVAVATGHRFCSECGTRLAGTPTPASTGDVTEAATIRPRSPTPPSGSRPEARLLPGTLLAGRYRIASLIGRGGMGEVYRADDLKLGRTVALKFLTPSLEGDASGLERFLGEVRVALRVSHENVCRVHDIGETDGLHFISMEYVDGEDLASLLRRIGRFPQDRGREIALQIGAGLTAAHRQGVLHRDLKPANVMLDGEGCAKITDFGLAALVDELQGRDIRVGTPAYMAPEQVTGREFTARSDIYSLGLLLYEIFTGQRAFGDLTFDDLVRGRRTEPPRPTSRVSSLAPVIETAILACLEPDPDDRPASVEEVMEALAGADASVEGASLDTRCLLVLPFEVRGSGEESDRIGQSLAEALVINLATAPGFHLRPVVGNRHGGRVGTTEVARIGRKERAGHVIHGALRRDDRAVELTLFLVDTADGRIEWGRQDRVENEDLATIASQVTREVVEQLGGSVARQYDPVKLVELEGDLATDPDALEAIGAIRRRDAWEALAKVRALMQRWPGKPVVHALHVSALYDAWHPTPSAENRAALEQALLRLEAVDPGTPYVDTFRGQLAYEGDGRPRAAIAAFSRVLERDDLSPTYRSWVLRNRAQPFQQIGDREQAMRDLEEAVRHSPVEPWNFYALSNVLCWSRRFDEALVEARRAVAFEPWDYRHRLVVGQALTGLERWDEALEHLELANRSRRAQHVAALRAYCLERAGRPEEARRAADEAAKLAESPEGLFYLARYRAAAGSTEEALRLLERAAEIGLATVDLGEEFPGLRDDPRLRAIVDSVRNRLENV